MTAYQAVTEELKLKAGETIFVACDSGGVGTIAVQLAHKIGAKVTASAGKDNQSYLKSLGADIVLDYTSGNVLALLRKQLPNGVDVALDCVGGDSAKTPVQAVRDGGRFAKLTGTDVGKPRMIEIRHIESEGTTARRDALVKMFDDGSLRVEIDKTTPAERSSCGSDRGRAASRARQGRFFRCLTSEASAKQG